MTAIRIRLVARLGPMPPRSRWFVGSLAFHVAVAATIALWPSGARTMRGPIGPRIAVDLVGGLPGPRTTAPAKAEPTAPAPKPKAEAKPEPPKPKEAALETRKVEVVEKPEKETPAKPEPQPEPLATDPAGPEEAAGTGTPSSGAADAGAGAGAADGGVAGDVGGGSLLGSEHAWYGARVTAALRANWRRPPLGNVREPLTVMVSFDILRDGSVRNPRVLESSGVPTLDRSALRAVVDAAPLPALPRDLAADVVPARFEFTWFPGES